MPERDTETESLRLERGASPAPDPRERQGHVPIAFSTAGVLTGGADAPDGPPLIEGEGAAEGQAAVERGAAAIERERRARPERRPDDG